jgi:hypothetical protein
VSADETNVETKKKAVADVDKPRQLKWEYTNPPDNTEWECWVELESKYQNTCGQAGLANKLWSAGYRYAPKTWDDKKNITEFEKVNSAQELYEAICKWYGESKKTGNYNPLGLIGQNSWGKKYIKALEKWDKSKVQKYKNFTWKQVKGGMGPDDLKAAIKLFKDCQYLELNVAGHVVSVGAIRLTKDKDGKITKYEAMIHDPDSDVIDCDSVPPKFKGDDEWCEMTIDNNKWKFDYKQGEDPSQVYGYKVFCPASYKVGKAAGAKKNPEIIYDPINKTLSFTSGAVNILDSVGGLSGEVEPDYAGDPILGASITISDLTLTDPNYSDPNELEPDSFYFPPGTEYGYAGYIFSGGTLHVTMDEQILLEAEFPFFRILHGCSDDIADNFSIITGISVNNPIGSFFLDDLSAQIETEGTIMDFYVEADGFDNLAQAFDNFETETAMSTEATYAVAKNGSTPDPPPVAITETSIEVSEEGLTTVDYSLSLNFEPNAPVYISAYHDTDDIVLNGSPNTVILTFTINEWNIPQPIEVTAVDDELLEDEEILNIHHNTASDDSRYNGVPIDHVVVTITDNDCGAWGYGPMDFNQNCYVDMFDFAIFVEKWLDCTLPYEAGCYDARE